MTHHKLTRLVAITLLAASCAGVDGAYTRYVDPHIGSGGHGHVFVGANVPFGLVQLGPTSIPNGWDWTSGYHISDTTVIGFSHMHLSGTGIGDLGDITFMPVSGDVTLARGHAADQQSGNWSYFSRKNERARPGYYATRLDRFGIDVELTATKRVGFHRYTFPPASSPAVIIDLVNGIGWDAPTEARVSRLDDRTIAGYRYSSGWASAQRVYFVAVFSRPISELQLYDNGRRRECDDLTARRLYAKALFNDAAGEQLEVKVALSPVSVENAAANLRAELPEWDFECTVEQADREWNRELGKIAIRAADPRTLRVFYTALYHTMIAPSEFSDVNGDYRGADGRDHHADGFVNYTTLSLWDTYRAAHPLMTIIHPEKMADIINTMLRVYQQQGKLPVWHLMGCETDCMVGNPAIPVVADAILKGYDGFDKELAFEAMKTSAMLDERGLSLLKQHGYIPCNLYGESVATGMEYALADWSIARVASLLGKTADADYFTRRAASYAFYFDPSVNFARGRDAEGHFRVPFDPFSAPHRANDYTEGNAWQYTWLAPHDVEGLINLFGSRQRFVEKLDSLFIVTGDMGAEASPDISGLIGQYAHGNEPVHHVIYLYTLAGQPWKAADRVREVLATLYHDAPDGLPGNEDVGQMSAWYILSALGFYQVEPAGGRFFFGSPIIDEAEIKVKDGRVFRVTALDNSPENRYIQSITLDGIPYREAYIPFTFISAGSHLVLQMGNTPADWTTGK
ncbi:MAG: GH92 family glycosyl hydrolase [Odoribacteraceae bacterium]|jgi:predicted alpha-1,2-mannosidase|nr:GH92 family glycosyl hydrolase [Odoribacteraceae bacterium]